MRFYFVADPINNGSAVAFHVFEGSELDRGEHLGQIIFTSAQWQAFSKVAYAATHIAGRMRVAIEFRDRSSTQRIKPTQH